MPDAKTHKFRLMVHLAQGILPFEQWAPVFANPELRSRPALICKAFAVWFPTMLDFLEPKQETKDAVAALAGEAVAAEVIELSESVGRHYTQMLSLFSREEQMFIRDRRLQNVHGVLSTFILDRIHIKYYDPARDAVVIEHIDANDYHRIMRTYYPAAQTNELTLRNRRTGSDIFREFGQLYDARLRIDPHLMAVARRLGVYAE